MKPYEKAAVKLIVKQIHALPLEDIRSAIARIYEEAGLFVEDDEIEYISKKVKESPDTLSESLQEIILKGGTING